MEVPVPIGLPPKRRIVTLTTLPSCRVSLCLDHRVRNVKFSRKVFLVLAIRRVVPRAVGHVADRAALVFQVEHPNVALSRFPTFVLARPLPVSSSIRLKTEKAKAIVSMSKFSFSCQRSGIMVPV